jgi:hypothetical protein
MREKEKKKTVFKPTRKIANTIIVISIYLPVLTLNIHIVKSPLKRCRLAEWIKIQDPTFLSLPEKIPHWQRYTD